MQLILTQHGRWELIKYLLLSSDGSHFDIRNQTRKEGMQFLWEKVKSYRIEPS